jgi:hypothetical protein
MAELQIKVLDVTPHSILLLEGEKKTKLIPANTFNTLKYVIRGTFEGMAGQSYTKIYLGDNCVISPTTQEYVFCLEHDGSLVHTTPDADKLVCEAVMKAHIEKDFTVFKSLFNDLYRKRLKNEFVELFLTALGQRVRSATIDELPGYIVDKAYFVGQNGSAYRIYMNDKLRFLCIVPKNHNIKPMTLTYNGMQISLGQQEQIFLSKIMMLLNKEKYRNDTVFWRQVEHNEG